MRAGNNEWGNEVKYNHVPEYDPLATCTFRAKIVIDIVDPFYEFDE